MASVSVGHLDSRILLTVEDDGKWVRVAMSPEYTGKLVAQLMAAMQTS